jgi:hypothetical protein
VSSWRRPGPITPGLIRCAKAVDQRLSTDAPRRMGPGLRQDDVDRVCAPFPIRFSNSTREAFEVTSPRSSRGEVEICDSEFRVRGSIRGLCALRQPLTIADAPHRRSSSKNGGRRPPEPLPAKGGARETRERGSAFSRHGIAPELFCEPPSKIRGRRECRERVAPAAACATKSTRVSNHRYAAICRHSLRNGFTAYIVLSLVTGLFCHHHSRDNPATLAPASGRQDHTPSPSASVSLASRHRCVHRIPLPTSVTTAKRPSCENGTVRTLRLIWVSEKAKYFLRGGWTGFCAREVICPSGKSVEHFYRHISTSARWEMTFPT